MRNALQPAMDDVAEVETVGAGDIRDAVIAVYRSAFGAPPYCRGKEDIEDFAESLMRHVRFGGFRLTVARSQSDRAIVGFV